MLITGLRNSGVGIQRKRTWEDLRLYPVRRLTLSHPGPRFLRRGVFRRQSPYLALVTKDNGLPNTVLTHDTCWELIMGKLGP